MTLLDEIRSFRSDIGLMLDINDPDSMYRALDKLSELLEGVIVTLERLEADNQHK